MVILIVLLVISVIISIVLGFSMTYKNMQIKYYKTLSNNLNSMGIMQKTFEIMGANIPANRKLEEMNAILLETFTSKYSTLVLFDGKEYSVKASNVEKMFLPNIPLLATDEDFKNNIIKNISKYLATSGTKTLLYKTAIERKIKSAMFSPLYDKETFNGFWILEDTRENAYDNISKEELSLVRSNLSVFLTSVLSQEIIERVEDTDRQTGIYNNFYLYTKGSYIINAADKSTMIMINIPGLKEVNEKYGRKEGDRYLLKVVEELNKFMTSDSIHVRYSGSKILSVAPYTDARTLLPTIERMQNKFKQQGIVLGGENISIDTNILLQTYVKNSDMERAITKLGKEIDEIETINSISISQD